MKVIEVVAAVIKRNDEIFVTRRSYGDFKDMWEFPGGKVEENESREDALHREIREELEVDITNLEYLTTVDYDYDTFHLKMHCYTCEISGGELKLNAHNDAKWIKASEMDELNWVPADVVVVNKIRESEILFENKYIMTMDNLVDLCMSVRKKSITLILAICAGLGVFFSIILLVKKNNYFYSAFSLLYAMFIVYLLVCYPRRRGKIIYERNLKLFKGESEHIIKFNEKNIYWYNVLSKAEINFIYEDIDKIIETKKQYIFLYAKTYFSVSKSGFIKGTEQDFHNFIINKCTNAKIRKSNIN